MKKYLNLFNFKYVRNLAFVLAFASLCGSELSTGTVIDVPFFINEEEIGSTRLLLDWQKDEFTFISNELIELTSKFLTDEGVQKLSEFLKEHCSFSGNICVKDEYFTTIFSPKDQSVRLDVDPHLIKSRSQKIRRANKRQYEKQGSQEIQPSALSGYLNVLAGHKFNHTYFLDYPYIKNETFGNFDWAINCKDWVLQGFAYYLGNKSNGLNRGNVVLTHDFIEKNIRFSLGDINMMGVGFQNSIPLVGASIHKNYRLSTDSIVGPISRHEIFLNVPSKVEVYVNGMLIKVLQLRSGPHLLEEFPLIDGSNNVQLKIYSPTGEERTVDLNYFYNAHLLQPGQIEYYVTLGWPTFHGKDRQAGFNRYGGDRVFSGFINFGLSNTTSVAAYLQTSFKDIFLGSEYIWSNNLFYTVFDIGMSSSAINTSDLTGRAAFAISGAQKKLITWRLFTEYVSKRFSFLGQKDANNSKRWVGAGSCSLHLTKRVILGFTSEYVNYRIGSDTYYGQVDLSTYINSYINLKSIGRYEQQNSGNKEWSIAFSADVSPRIKDIAFKTNFNSKQKMLIAEAVYSTSLSRNRSFAASLGYTKAPRSNSATGSVAYEGTRCNLNASHYLAKLSSVENDSTVNITNVNGGASIVFANNTVTLSRPIRDSFVIISPNKYLKRTNLLVNPTFDGDYTAKATYLLPAALPVRSYNSSIFQISTEEDVIGQSFASESFLVNSRYKTGSLISIGEPKSYIFEGLLKQNNGKAIENIGGLLISVDKQEKNIYPFFTDYKGKMQIIGVVAGEYEIALTDKMFISKRIKIKTQENDVNFIDIGEIILNRIDLKEERRKLIEQQSEVESD